MEKRRAEWRVQLRSSNYKNVEGTYARVDLKGNLTTDQLAEIMVERNPYYPIDTVQAITSQMADLMEEFLLKGYSISGEMGTLMPTVTGPWDFDRIQPAARAKNKAEVRFSMSKRLKKQLEDPLFHPVTGRKQGPMLNPANRFPMNDKWEFVMKPDSPIFLTGNRLLMNGDDPSCGFYLIDAETGEVCRFFPREELLFNSRTQIMVKLNGELPPGLYRFRVISQCTTSNIPLQKPYITDSTETYRIYPEGEKYVIIEEGKKIM